MMFHPSRRLKSCSRAAKSLATVLERDTVEDTQKDMDVADGICTVVKEEMVVLETVPMDPMVMVVKEATHTQVLMAMVAVEVVAEVAEVA